MEKLIKDLDPVAFADDMQDKINEIVEWINKYEKTFNNNPLT